MVEEDFGFYAGPPDENPIAAKLLESAKKGLAEMPTPHGRFEEQLVGHQMYSAAAFAELERRVIVLEGLVRDLMSR
jgi:hypothetical protein